MIPLAIAGDAHVICFVAGRRSVAAQVIGIDVKRAPLPRGGGRLKVGQSLGVLSLRLGHRDDRLRMAPADLTFLSALTTLYCERRATW